MAWRNLIWMSIILCLAGLAFYLSRRTPQGVPPNDPAVEDLSAVVKAYKLIRAQGYRDLPPWKARLGAIEGMVAKVDRFCAYIPPGKVAPFTRRVAGTLEETGLRIASEGGRLVVVGPLPDSPAHKAGLFAGLEILEIDGVPADLVPFEAARRHVSAPAAGKVSLLLGDPRGRRFVKELESGRFYLQTVTGLVRDDAGDWVHELDPKRGICYLRISEFVSRTPGELQDAYRGLTDPRGLILDVRDNPGGMLPAVVQAADRFLPAGVIVRTVGRDGSERVYRAHEDGTYPPVPVVVLIDGGTASAAEIFAGAFQVRGRAVLVGQTSYGKWCVQTPLSLGEGLGQIYLTTAEYFLDASATTQPSQPATADQAYAAERPGLEPDVAVELPPAAAEELRLLRLRAVVARAAEGQPATAPARRQEAEALKRSILRLDSQLVRALEMLQAGRVPTTRPAGSRPGP